MPTATLHVVSHAGHDVVRKRVFRATFILKTIHLLRQARDKHRGNSKNEVRFCTAGETCTGGMRVGDRQIHALWLAQLQDVRTCQCEDDVSLH